MKICHITSVHPRMDIRIFKKMCVTLANRGHEVVLLVADGKGDELINGLKIIDVGDLTSSRIKRLFSGTKLMLQHALKIAADVYQIHDPELLILANKLKQKGKCVIYDSHEDVPNQILYKTWLGPSFSRKILSKSYNLFEKRTVKKLDGLVSVIDEITAKFSCKHKQTIKNYPTLASIKEITLPIEERNNEIIYIGGLTEVRGIKDCIKALSYLPDNIRLKLIGSFSSEQFEASCRQLSEWERVDYMGYLPVEEAMRELVKAKIGLGVLHPENNYLMSLPTKGFEYMAALVPQVMSDFPYWRKFFNESGILISPKSPEKIASAISKLLDDQNLYKEKVQKCKELHDQYSWEKEADKYITFLINVVNN